MLPLITRSTQEVLRLVPSAQREGAFALGASRWRTVLGIILPSALGGILTGTVLAIARAAGETAPLLFATGIFGGSSTWNVPHAMPNMPVQIFIWSESPDPEDHKRAWATAFVLLVFVLIASLLARIALLTAAESSDAEQGGQREPADTMPPMRPVDVASAGGVGAAHPGDGLRHPGAEGELRDRASRSRTSTSRSTATSSRL